MIITCPGQTASPFWGAPPHRVVSFSPSATESLVALGCGSRIVGATQSCLRASIGLEARLMGDYLEPDLEGLRQLDPDLVILTKGLHSSLEELLRHENFQVLSLPMPASRWGILENLLTLGAAMDRMPQARTLCDHMEKEFAALIADAPAWRPRVFIELWLGAHLRTIQGRTFVHDLVQLAGGDPLFADGTGTFLMPRLRDVVALKPDVWLLFQDPLFPVCGDALAAKRGWTWPVLRIDMGVERGGNPVHDGPSFLETARYLRECMMRVEAFA